MLNPYIVKLASEGTQLSDQDVRNLNLIAQAEIDAIRDHGISNSSEEYFSKKASCTDQEAIIYKTAYAESFEKLKNLKIQGQGEADALFEEGMISDPINVIDKTANYTVEERKLYSDAFTNTKENIKLEKTASDVNMKNAFEQEVLKMVFDKNLRKQASLWESNYLASQKNIIEKSK